MKNPEKKVDPPLKQSLHQQYIGWTPLNTTVYKVFMEVRKDPSFKWLGRMKALPQNRSTQKYCEYHNDHGHYTEDCISLRFEIEKFIRNGKLLKFVAEEKGREKNLPNPQNQTIVGEIRTISGGLAGGGQSSSVRKAYVKQVRTEEVFSLEKPSKIRKQELSVLSFSEEDAKEISMPHDEALVITLTVANHAIHQVLVDNGSSADILYETVVQQLGIGREKLKPFLSPLIGFAG
ncbi:uncharacterized protein LOC132162427 [Corylus avellana]|uniref:uncharacterized protein LOC132162427 n=1 Tax=Corylus avellana TaxID=13451 RepID=UPI00286C3116|nr:uncharacterized protein LOC132162427 [Corylus avellana]